MVDEANSEEGEERKEARGKTWGRVIELPGGAVGLTSRFASADIKRNC